MLNNGHNIHSLLNIDDPYKNKYGCKVIKKTDKKNKCSSSRCLFVKLSAK